MRKGEHPPRNQDSFSLSQGKCREVFQRNVPIEPALWEAIRKIAKQQDRSMSSFIRIAIRKELEHYGIDVAELEQFQGAAGQELYKFEIMKN